MGNYDKGRGHASALYMKKYMKKLLFKTKTRWKRRDVILLFERLEMYVAAGLTINKALAIGSEGIPKKQSNSLARVREAVEAGVLLSRSLVANIGVNETIAGLVEHGESSGELGKALSTARSLLEREDELLKKCLSAMAYPMVIALAALVLIVGLVRGVMPQIIPMLKSLHVQLPLLTRIIIFISENLTSYGIHIGLGLAALLIGGRFAYRRSQAMKKTAHTIMMCIPIFGRLLVNYSLAVFLRSCGSLVESGLGATRAFANTVATIPLVPLRTQLQREIPNVNRGQSLGSILAIKGIPPYIPPLLNAGEASGTLGMSMLRAASILDRDIEHALKKLTSLIEPVMMAGMGTCVGAIALSIMMPIYDISKVLQH
jgi:type II secretory pathway component PulF